MKTEIKSDNDLLLFDRLEVIRQTLDKYGEENFYISFSGGRDSTALSALVDMAKPNNKIPRVFANTGIEYNLIVDFVKKKAEKDERIVIIKPSQNIKTTLEQYGYPFKSKEYSNWLKVYQKHKDRINPYFERIEANPALMLDYDFIVNLPVNVKYIIKSFYGIRERERERAI